MLLLLNVNLAHLIVMPLMFQGEPLPLLQEDLQVLLLHLFDPSILLRLGFDALVLLDTPRIFAGFLGLLFA